MRAAEEAVLEPKQRRQLHKTAKFLRAFGSAASDFSAAHIPLPHPRRDQRLAPGKTPAWNIPLEELLAAE
jgi:hypothetical protein